MGMGIRTGDTKDSDVVFFRGGGKRRRDSTREAMVGLDGISLGYYTPRRLLLVCSIYTWRNRCFRLVFL